MQHVVSTDISKDYSYSVLSLVSLNTLSMLALQDQFWLCHACSGMCGAWMWCMMDYIMVHGHLWIDPQHEIGLCSACVC